MKQYRRFERSMSEDRGELRVLLQEWKAPAPPPAMEQALRLRMRRRPTWKRRGAWLAAAASVALVLLARRAAPPPGAPYPSSQPRSAAPQAPARSSAGSVAALTIPPSPPRGGRPASGREGLRRAEKRVRSEPAVLVEPGQAALYVELARQLRGTQQVPAGASPPPVEVIPVHARPTVEPPLQSELLPHSSVWEVVGSEWPSVRRAL